MNDDPEIELQADEWRATIAPYGASLRGATWRGEPVVTDYSGKANKMGGQGDVLIPFAGRVAGARYDWQGHAYQLPATDKDGPNAIHGFLRTRDWEVTAQTESSVHLAIDFDGAEGYPFPLRATIEYSLNTDGLTCAFTVVNVGPVDAPVAVGFHPYFSAGSPLVDADVLTLPFASVLEFENLIPTGRVLPVAEIGMDFRDGRPIGETRFNHCFLHPERDDDGLVRVVLAGERRTVTVWMDGAFDYAVLYTGDPMPESHRRRALAIEPMTAGSDSLNRPEWGLIRLAPGQSAHGGWGATTRSRDF